MLSNFLAFDYSLLIVKSTKNFLLFKNRKCFIAQKILQERGQTQVRIKNVDLRSLNLFFSAISRFLVGLFFKRKTNVFFLNKPFYIFLFFIAFLTILRLFSSA